MKYKVREAMEAVVGAVTGPVAAPRSLPLGRYDDHGRLQYIGRTTTLAQAAGSTVGALLAPARPSMDGLVVLRQVGHQGDDERHQPELVVGVVVDVARDASGRWRHPARLHRARPDLQPADIPRLTSPPHCGADTLLRCRGRFHRCDTDSRPTPPAAVVFQHVEHRARRCGARDRRVGPERTGLGERQALGFQFRHRRFSR